MLRKELFFVSCTTFLVLFPAAVTSQGNQTCKPSSCGNIHNITYPFRLKGDPKNCNNHRYELACEKNVTVLNLSSGKFFVQEINYDNFTLRISDSRLQKNNCSSLPLYSLTHSNFSYYGAYDLYDTSPTSVTFLNCENRVNSLHYVSTSPCLNGGILSSTKRQYYSYVVVGGLDASEIANSCTIVMTSWIMPLAEKGNGEFSYSDIHNELVYGFEISYYKIHCRYCEVSGYKFRDKIEYARCHRQCYFSDSDNPGILLVISKIVQYLSYLLYPTAIGPIVAAKTLCGCPCIFAFLIYKWRRRHLSMYDGIEEFLHNNNIMPIRYSYTDIRKMTKGFREKLGEGGYGSVYKGTLRSGRLVAIKMLGKSKANGQDFINEVATIGRIHHVNVVKLIGYCVEGPKRALLYEFMPNGSLEKYIFHQGEGNVSINCKKMYEISLGVARGIDYLHQGCDMQILHFDIKPHNILLDENFTPKVSDFGLAKLYPTDDSIVNLTAARGTMGYMAPELFYKNIGGVSYKADVYSFGMLLMEMASKRKNFIAQEEHSSQVYFPSWVYDQFIEGKDIEMGDIGDSEREIEMRMKKVALWCIQMKPSDRPSMSRVVEMLEGNVEIAMPAKPLFYPAELSNMVQADNNNPAAPSLNAMDTITLEGR